MRELRERAARVAENEQLEDVPPKPVHLLDIPEDALQMITEQLAKANAGNALDLCNNLRNWCKTHPKACSNEALWREVFEVAFGTPVMDPPPAVRLNVSTWREAFNEVCAGMDAVPVPDQARWARVASWTDREIDEQLATWAEVARPPRALSALLHLRGGSLARYRQRRKLDGQLLDGLFNRETDLVREVLELDADAAYVNKYGQSRLHALLDPIVTDPIDPELLRLLLQHGAVADINLRHKFGHLPRRHEPNGETPLFMAVRRRDVELVRILLNAGADPNIPCRSWQVGSNQVLSDPKTARQRAIEDERSRPGGSSPEGREIVKLLDAAIMRKLAVEGLLNLSLR
tara:strand:- start:1040 stop:2077 length:1038 start_codon:yes stop_codon:yes gene_type:complete